MSEEPLPEDGQLLADVRKMIFSDCKNTTPWDHLGNLDAVRSGNEKHVSFHVDPDAPVVEALHHIELPVGIGLLFEASSGNRPQLDYFATVVAMPPPPEDHCLRLYDQGMDRLARLRAEEAERVRLAMEAEERECTFQPKVSDTGPRRETEAFIQHTLDWHKKREQKLVAKRQKEQRENDKDAELEIWQIGKRSEALAKRKRAKDAAEGPRAREIPREEQHSFAPVTNSSKRLQDYLLQQVTMGDAEGTGDNESFVAELKSVTQASQIVNRLEEDTVARRKRQEERKLLYISRQNERLYDKLTGQPLFVPNAMPMVDVGKGKRVPLDSLPKAEQKEFRKKMNLFKVDFVQATATRKDNCKMHEAHDHVRIMEDRQKEAKKGLSRIRRQDERELEKLFKPQIEAKSAEIASNSERRRPLYELSSEKSASSLQSTPERTPTAKPKVNIGHMIARSEDWQDKRKQRIAAHQQVAAEAEQQLTFTPELNRQSKRLADAAEQRYAAEVKQTSRSGSYASPQLKATRSTSRQAAVPNPGGDRRLPMPESVPDTSEEEQKLLHLLDSWRQLDTETAGVLPA